MDAMLVLLLVVAGFALFGAAAMSLGAETRSEFEDRSLRGDIAT